MTAYLVTGGCGFLGSHLVAHLLAGGHRVRVLDDLSNGRRDSVAEAAEFHLGDVTDRQAVADAMRGVDGCFHLAALSSVERCSDQRAREINLTGTVNVFEAARSQGGASVPVVYASSAAVYGEAESCPVAETAPLRPLSAYGEDKLRCEQQARRLGRQGLRSIGLRFFNIYGPGQDPRSPYSGVISRFCARLSTGEPLDLHGGGDQIRDFVYVGDAVAALSRAMSLASDKAPCFNVCTGRGTPIRRLAELIAELYEVSAVTRPAPPRAGDIRLSIGDPRRARDALGLCAPVDLDAGLRRTVRAFADRPPP